MTLAGRNGHLDDMGNPLSKPVDWRTDASAALTAAAQPGRSLEDIRARFSATERRAESGVAGFRDAIESIVTDFERLLATTDLEIDVEGLIDQLDRFAEKDRHNHKTLRKTADRVLRYAAQRRPELLPLLNAFHQHAGNTHRQWLETYRDMRWRLMAARAHHRPSAPAGLIEGQHTDLDDYLRSAGQWPAT